MKIRILLLAVVIIGLSVVPNFAQDGTEITIDSVVAGIGIDAVPNLSNSKLDSHLFQLNREFMTYVDGGSIGTFETHIQNVVLRNGNLINIDFVARGDIDQLLLDLQALGLQNGIVLRNMISGHLPIAALNQLDGLSNLQHARYPVAMVNNAGSVANQANQAMGADTARSTYGIDGSGFTVGVLSDSFDCNLAATGGSYATDIGTGDLPSGMIIVDDTSCSASSINEGRAMAQLIYDVVPGSQLAFHTAFNGEADFAQGIIDLANAGSDVIVDDVFYLTEPVFQDGVIAQAVDTVVAQNIPYFSSAGNTATNSYEANFADSGINLNFTGVNGKSYDMHDFDSGSGVDYLMDFSMPANTAVQIAFHWDEPYGSLGGASSVSDMDLILVDDQQTGYWSYTSVNNVGGDPVEIMYFVNSTGSTQNMALIIGLVQGHTAPTRVKFTDYAESQTFEHFTNSPTISPHARSATGAGVAAAWYTQTPAYGTTPPLAESFTSLGGTQVYFDTSGNRYGTPLDRMQPRFTAPDGTDTTFFYPGVDPESNGNPNFFGTSAAAPHAAAVAALILEVNPNLSPAGIYNLMESSAIDMNTGGFDYLTGYGLVQADDAIDMYLNGLDVNNSGRVTPADAVYVINRMGGSDMSADVDWDGDVDAADVQLLIANFGFTP